MTGITLIHDPRVIKHGPDEGTSVMTDTAIGGGRHMADELTFGKDPIMTGTAIIGNTHVIEGSRDKTSGYMA